MYVRIFIVIIHYIYFGKFICRFISLFSFPRPLVYDMVVKYVKFNISVWYKIYYEIVSCSNLSLLALH